MSNRYAGKMTSSLLGAMISLGVALPLSAATPEDPYASGMRQVREAIASGDLGSAEKTTQLLLKRYGNNVELLSVRARVLFWQKRYDESIACYRAAQKLKPGPELSGELKRVQAAQQLAEADRLMAEKQEEKALKILARLFEAGSETYETGLRLSRLHMRRGDAAGAQRVLVAMLKQFPRERDLVLLNAEALLGKGEPGEALAFLEQRAETGKDAQLLALRGRALYRLHRHDEAAESFRGSLALADDLQVRQERERALLAALLERSDRLAAQGESAQAVELLRGAFESGGDRYGTGTRLAALYTRMGDYREAGRVYLLLMSGYPKESELALLYAQSLANAGRKEEALVLLEALQQKQKDPGIPLLRSRILMSLGRYPEAQAELDRAVALGASASELAAERSEAEAALNYQQLKEMVAAKDYNAAQPLLDAMAAAGPYAREVRLLNVKVLLARNEPDRAVSYSEKLYREHPADAEVAALYAEALLQAGRTAQAQGVLDEAGAAARGVLEAERLDLFFRTRGNWAKLFVGGAEYSSGYGSEKVAGAAIFSRFKRFTGVATALQATRFGRTDTQLALDLYQARREGDSFYGNLNLTLSPDASFLPRYSVGIEAVRPLGSFELSAGYNRIDFKDDGANVLVVGGLWYIPATPFSLGERVYLSAENRTAMSLTTLRWDPGYRLGASISLGAGNSSEKVTIAEDLQRYTTYSLRAGIEYRITPSWSVGGDASFESRRKLYDRHGGAVFVKYWWP